MEQISITILELSKYGILGIFLVLFIWVIKYLFTKVELLQTQFITYLETSNEKLFALTDKTTDVIAKNTTVSEKIICSLDGNTTVNKKFSEMVEQKLDVLNLIKKMKPESK